MTYYHKFKLNKMLMTFFLCVVGQRKRKRENQPAIQSVSIMYLFG